MDLGSQPSTAGVEPPLLDQGWEAEQSPCLLGSTSLEPSHSNVDHRSGGGGVELPSAPLLPPLPLWGDCNTCLKFEGKGVVLSHICIRDSHSPYWDSGFLCAPRTFLETFSPLHSGGGHCIFCICIMHTLRNLIHSLGISHIG